MRLLPAGRFTGGWIGAPCGPDDLFWVARSPSALAGMSYPGRADWSLLHAEGIGHIVCLSHDVAPYDPAPCTITAYRLRDLIDGRPPPDPDRERAVILEAATDVLVHLERGTGVAVHCMGGRGRTGTVLGVALVRLGHAPGDVIDYLDRVAVARGRRGWPESAWQAEAVTASA